MRRRAWTITCLVTALCLPGRTGAAGGYPLLLTAKAQATQGETTITSTVKIYVDRLMEPSRRTRVIDGLKYNGYQGFMNALRPLPAIGRVESQRGRVDLRYAWETKVENGRRLVLVADKPLFFLAADTAKPRAGYELTVVDPLQQQIRDRRHDESSVVNVRVLQRLHRADVPEHPRDPPRRRECRAGS